MYACMYMCNVCCVIMQLHVHVHSVFTFSLVVYSYHRWSKSLSGLNFAFLSSIPMIFSSCTYVFKSVCVIICICSLLLMCSCMCRGASLMPRCLALFSLESTELSHSLKVPVCMYRLINESCRNASSVDQNAGYSKLMYLGK